MSTRINIDTDYNDRCIMILFTKLVFRFSLRAETCDVQMMTGIYERICQRLTITYSDINMRSHTLIHNILSYTKQRVYVR